MIPRNLIGKVSFKRQKPIKVKAILIRPICGSIYLFNPIKAKRHKLKCRKQNKRLKEILKTVRGCMGDEKST